MIKILQEHWTSYLARVRWRRTCRSAPWCASSCQGSLASRGVLEALFSWRLSWKWIRHLDHNVIVFSDLYWSISDIISSLWFDPALELLNNSISGSYHIHVSQCWKYEILNNPSLSAMVLMQPSHSALSAASFSTVSTMRAPCAGCHLIFKVMLVMWCRGWNFNTNLK